MREILILLSILYGIMIHAENKIKIACIGDSVTEGYLLPSPEKNAYPSQLQILLGDNYEVGNFGKSGATLLNNGHRPYMQQEAFRKALDFNADLAVIHLGLNDTDPRNWPNYRDEFAENYYALIDSVRKSNPKCKIWICRLSPITFAHRRFISGTRDWYRLIQHEIEQIAKVSNVEIIDFQAPLYSRIDLFPDALHPDTEGAEILAQTVFKHITGNFGGLKLPEYFTDNMVLQRDKAIKIEGTSDAGDKISVVIGKQKQKTTTSSNGKWIITLDPLMAGTNYTLTVKGNNKTLTYSNVAVGEVWLCSGQSNMAWMVKQAAEAKEMVAQAKNQSNIRFFNKKPICETTAIEWENNLLDSINKLIYYRPAQWEICNETSANNFSAIAFAFGKMLADSLNVPIGLVHNAIGGSSEESWIDRSTLELEFPAILNNWQQNDLIQEWCRQRATLNIKKSAKNFQRHPFEPCYLFESGIAPLKGLPLSGIIWYQGESNAHNIEIHQLLFPMIVKSWRLFFEQEDLFFNFVQLSSLNRPSWCWFRDTQRRQQQELPRIGMAVSSDKGDSLDVHPRRKQVIGERLAYWALNRCYGHTVTPSGPLFSAVTFKKEKAYIAFNFSEGMKSSDGFAIRSFEIAGADKIFYPAEAIVSNKQVVVSSKKVKTPYYVRYGWQPFTRGNLINEAGLPASTFITE